MNTANAKTRGVEVIPAVLVKTRDLLLQYIQKVSPHVKSVHIDVMDDEFVPNRTVGLEELKSMPKGMEYEFHWMVKAPEKWIAGINGDNLHLVHVETIDGNWAEIVKAVNEAGGRLGLVINPDTALEKILEYVKDAKQVLVMAVNPGFSGQSYMKGVEEKIAYLRSHFPDLDIEVDGGVDEQTAASAVKAGANKLAAATAIFRAQDAGEAIRRLEAAARKGLSHV